MLANLWLEHVAPMQPAAGRSGDSLHAKAFVGGERLLDLTVRLLLVS